MIYTFENNYTITVEDFLTRKENLSTLDNTFTYYVDPQSTDLENQELQHLFCIGVDSNADGWIADTDRDVILKVTIY